MMLRSRTPLHYALFTVLVALNLYVWIHVIRPAPSYLRVSILDIGQGDAILIESPTGTQVLIDGGPDRSVVRELPKEMGILDRSLDMVVATHPDKDHIAGLADVFARYTVATYLDSGVVHHSPYVDALAHAVETEPNLTHLTARRDMQIHLGGGAYLEVLYPDRSIESVESNTGSVVMRLVYGATSFMLTGDAPAAVENYLVSLDGTALQSTVLKAGHHGSKTSTSAQWLAHVQPQVVVVSAGKGNSYGHPSPEVVERIQEFNAELLSTIERGTIELVSDGQKVWKE